MGNGCVKKKKIEEEVCILDFCDGCSQLCNTSELEVVKNYCFDIETKLCQSCLYKWETKDDLI